MIQFEIILNLTFEKSFEQFVSIVQHFAIVYEYRFQAS